MALDTLKSLGNRRVRQRASLRKVQKIQCNQPHAPRPWAALLSCGRSVGFLISLLDVFKPTPRTSTASRRMIELMAEPSDAILQRTVRRNLVQDRSHPLQW